MIPGCDGSSDLPDRACVPLKKPGNNPQAALKKAVDRKFGMGYDIFRKM